MKTQNTKNKTLSILLFAAGLILSTISTAQIKVDVNGNVGIGTTSPAFLLSAVKNQNGVSRIAVSNNNTGSSSYSIFHAIGATGSAYLGTSRAAVLGNTAGTEVAFIQSVAVPLLIGTANSNDLRLSTSAIERMRITSSGNVGIGTTNPTSKLSVTTSTSGDIAVKGNNIATSGSNFGAYFDAMGSTSGANYGVFARAGGGVSNYSLFLGSLSASANNYALYSTADAKSYFSGDVGIGTSNPGHKLEVNGTFHVNGVATCTAGAWGSDQQFKTNLDTIQSASDLIKQLKPKTYYFDTTNVWGLNFPSKKQYGFIAQELEQVLPELVTSVTKNAEVDTAGNVIHPATTYKAVYYLELIALLTKGIQEQQQKIDNLAEALLAEQTKTTEQDTVNENILNQLDQLSANIISCCTLSEARSTPANNANQTEVSLTDAQSIVLEQNVPNPFAEQTSINYYLPDNTQKAQMLFYNAQGRLIQSTDLIQKGKGVVNVFASDLSNGIYTFTLVVDGKIIETKKMVKQ